MAKRVLRRKDYLQLLELGWHPEWVVHRKKRKDDKRGGDRRSANHK